MRLFCGFTSCAAVRCLLMVFTVAAARNVGRFWHVTDFHYDQTYFTEQLSCNDEVPRPGPFGDYWCDSPWRLVQSAVDFMAQTSKTVQDVDFVIWTGDTVAHIHDEDTSWRENLKILQKVTSLLEESLPCIPVYPSLGNHDFHPSDQAEGDWSEFYTAMAYMWHRWMDVSFEFLRGGFYSSQPLSKDKSIRVLALNTNLYGTANKEASANVADPAGQFKWLVDQLEMSRAYGEKIIITGHIPPGPLTRGLVRWMKEKPLQRLVDILLEYSDVIVATHFGHEHQDGFKILQSSDGRHAVSQFTAPSVTPWRFKVKLPNSNYLIGDPHNPSVRLVEYDRDTGAHLDYHQYFFNLTDANRDGQATWVKLYSFTTAYDVPDMSVASIRKIMDRIRDGGGEKYTTRYCRYASVSRQDTTCTNEMRRQVYCAGLHYNVTEAQACMVEFIDSQRVEFDDSQMVKYNDSQVVE